jgi:hypothetical protein
MLMKNRAVAWRVVERHSSGMSIPSHGRPPSGRSSWLAQLDRLPLNAVKLDRGVYSPRGAPIGEDNIMWGSDYPHPDGIWPDSQKWITADLGSVSPIVRCKIVCENAGRLYGLL